MAYFPTVPQPTQRINDSQPQIQANFTQIQTTLGINHVTFTGAAADWGKHNVVTFPTQAAVPASLADEILLYNKVPAAPFPLTTRRELFLQRNGGTLPIHVPITAASRANNGYTYLPSGLLIRYGSGVTSAADPSVLAVTFAAPLYTAIPYVSVSIIYDAIAPAIPGSRFVTYARTALNTITFSGWDLNANAAQAKFSYICIGW